MSCYSECDGVVADGPACGYGYSTAAPWVWVRQFFGLRYPNACRDSFSLWALWTEPSVKMAGAAGAWRHTDGRTV